MSEDFDREAEKERLREKLEGDQKRREATEHMSDLLLKGATMTNRHCDACGDPVFRYDGQEFCPTCGETVDDGDAGAEAHADDGGAEAHADDGGAEAHADDGGAEAHADDVPDAGATASDVAAPGAEGGNTATRNPGAVDAGPSPERPDPSTPAPNRTASRSPGASDLGEARASLVRTLTDLAARAERADDARRTRDLLSAAREAAEAIAALDRADR